MIIAPRNVGIYIILGISTHFHPLIDERGFYTLDGKHRLFIMPFQGSRLDDDMLPDNDDDVADNDDVKDDVPNNSEGRDKVPNEERTQQYSAAQEVVRKRRRRRRRRRTMWQLSFPVTDQNEATKLNQMTPSQIKEEVYRRCQHWHEPFPCLLLNTPLTTIWSTSLLDRDPDVFIQHRALLEKHGRLPSRVVLLGDAVSILFP